MARDSSRDETQKLHKKWQKHQAFMAELAQNKEWLDKIEKVSAAGRSDNAEFFFVCLFVLFCLADTLLWCGTLMGHLSVRVGSLPAEGWREVLLWVLINRVENGCHLRITSVDMTHKSQKETILIILCFIWTFNNLDLGNNIRYKNWVIIAWMLSQHFFLQFMVFFL